MNKIIKFMSGLIPGLLFFCGIWVVAVATFYHYASLEWGKPIQTGVMKYGNPQKLDFAVGRVLFVDEQVQLEIRTIGGKVEMVGDRGVVASLDMSKQTDLVWGEMELRKPGEQTVVLEPGEYHVTYFEDKTGIIATARESYVNYRIERSGADVRTSQGLYGLAFLVFSAIWFFIVMYAFLRGRNSNNGVTLHHDSEDSEVANLE